MEALYKNFLDCPNEQNGSIIQYNLRYHNLYNIATLIGEYLCNLFPENQTILSETAISSYYAKKYKLSYKLYSKLLNYSDEKNIDMIINNRKFSVPYIQNSYTKYNKKNIEKINQKKGTKNLSFIMSNTDNYEAILNSFINCCLDVYKIREWFYLDKNLSDENKNNIKSLYPFFKFISSIEEIKTKYVFYMNGENTFFAKKRYIHECMSILNHSNLEQCFINKLSTALCINKTKNNVFYYDSFSTMSKKIISPCLLTNKLLKKYIEHSKHSYKEYNFEEDMNVLINEINDNDILNNPCEDDKINLYNAHIKSYYKDKKELGLKIGCFLLDNKIDINRQLIESNQLFYLKSLKDIEGSNVYELTKPIFDIDDPKDEYKDNKYGVLNPSLYIDENSDIWVNIRHVSFISKDYIPMSKDNKVKTRNTFGKLNRTTYTIDEVKYEIIDCAEYKKFDDRVLGFEDMKIFRYKNRWCFVCTSYETSKTTNVLFGRLDENPYDNNIWETHYVLPLVGDMVSENKPEKNWMPILDNSEQLSFLYSTFPLHIVTLDENNKNVITTINKSWDQNIGDFRGSSCLIPYILDNKNGYIYVIHEVYYIEHNRHYIHRFVWLSKEYNILKFSNPFFLEHNNNIEYCNGLVYEENEQKFYISYGDNDIYAKLLTIPKNKVDSILNDGKITFEQYKTTCFIDKYC